MKVGNFDRGFRNTHPTTPVEPPVPYMFMLYSDGTTEGYHRTATEGYHQGRDKFEVMLKLKEKIESMPQTAQSFRISDVDGVAPSAGLHEDLLRALGSWPVGSQDVDKATLWANPNYCHVDTIADLADRDERVAWFHHCALMRMTIDEARKRTGLGSVEARRFIANECPFNFKDVRDVGVRRWSRTWQLAQAQGTDQSTIAELFDIRPRTVRRRIDKDSAMDGFDPADFLGEHYRLAVGGGMADKRSIVVALETAEYDLPPSGILGRLDSHMSEYRVRKSLDELVEEGVVEETRQVSRATLYDTT